MFKRVVTILLSLCMCFSTAFASGATAGSASNSSAATRTDWLTGEYGTTFVEVNSVEIEIPVIRNSPSPVTTSGGVATVTETIFVPDMTEEALDRNRQIVSEIKTYGAPATRGYGDFYVRGYIWYHSTLNYTTTTVQSKTYFDLLSFKLEREIYTNAPFNSFRNATARAVQVGYPHPDYAPYSPYEQENDYGTIPYDQLHSIPSSWVPVSPAEQHIGVHYTVYIDFLSSFGQSDYPLSYTHQAV